MANLFDDTNPANTQGVKLGAQRIRDMKTILNNTLGRLFSLSATDAPAATVSEVANSVSGTMLKQHASDDSQRSVGTDHIKAGAVTAPKMASNAVATASLVDASVTTDKIADLNVSTAKLADLSVSTAKLADSAVTQAKLAASEITSEKFSRPRKWVRFNRSPLTAGVLVRTSGSVVTATIASHGLRVGDKVFVNNTSASVGTNFDGMVTVATVPTTSTFTFSQSGTSGATNTGSSGLFFAIGASSWSLTGSPASVTCSRSGSTVTVTWTAHGRAVNDRVRISGSANTALNGEFLVTVIDANTFTYSTSTSGTISSIAATGQVLARDVSDFSASDPSGRATITVTLAAAMPDSEFTVLATVNGPTTNDFNFMAIITSTSVITVETNETGSDNDIPSFSLHIVS